MLTLLILFVSVILFFTVGYKFYADRIDKDIIQPDDSHETPANTMQDGVDYVPAPEIVLFGHHFSSIAGAGPIIGPIVAVANFGWVATLGWILMGSIFIGAVHDYVVLMVSVRNQGKSMSDVAKSAMSPFASMIFSIFIWLALILIVSVFAILAAKTLVVQPEMVIPTFGIVLVAILFGTAVYRYKMNLVMGTVLAVGLNIFLLLLGYRLPLPLPDPFLGLSPLNFWFVVILIYCSIASILPVNILLQPRDYISTFNLYACLGFGVSALIWVHPHLSAPAFISFQSVSQGPMYPMLFILVACGAVSGFHALVGGGTTSKQLKKESHGKPVAYGGMLLEGVLAVMTLLMVGGGLYWTTTEGVDMDKMGFYELLKSGGWIIVFGKAFGNLVHQSLPFIPLTVAGMIAMISLNSFIMTTTDTATRIARFVVEESLGEKLPQGKIKKFIALAICIIPIFIIGYTNSCNTVWPVFGATNQLIASLALFVVSSYLLGLKKPTLYTLIPGIFMLITTISALCWQGYNFLIPSAGQKPNHFLGVLCIILILLAIFVAVETWRVFTDKRKVEKEGEK